MKRPRKNVRVVFSDSEPDLNDERDESTDDASATKRSPSHLGSKTNPVINDDSSNSNDDDLRGASESNDAIPSAISSNRDPGNCKSTIQSDDNTLSPIEGSKTVKRKASNGGISPHNIISPSARASNESLSQNDGEPPGKLRRLTRGHGRSTVSYDMKHHPMDDVLQPKFSLKRRANRNPIPDDSSDSDEEIDGDDTNDAPSGKVTSSNPHCRRSSRKVHQSQTPIYSAKWHPLDQMLRDNASLTSVSKKDGRSKKIRANTSDSSSMAKDEEGSMTVNSDLNLDQDAAAGLEGGTVPISPDRRRSTRISSTNAPPNYDMKYHMMDSTIRPKAAAKRMKSMLDSLLTPHTSSNPSSQSATPAKTPTKKPAKISQKSSSRRAIDPEFELDGSDVPVAPTWSQLQNPYLNNSSLNWADVQPMDRSVYLLRKGAPLHGNTLPQDWTHDAVKKVLFDEGVITLDELNSREGTELLKTRHESVRLGLQIFFGSKPEPVDKRDWTLSKIEGFDVYDMKRGSKYWKHRKNSVVEKTKTSSRFNILGFAAETANNVTRNNNQEAADSISEDRDRNEATAPTSMRDFKIRGTSISKSSLNWPPAMKVDNERTTFVDREDDGELNENSLIESMRGEHVTPSIMSDAALEELLFPVEQLLRGEPGQEVAAKMVWNDPRNSEPAGAAPARPNEISDKISSIASEATATDDTLSNRGLAGVDPLGKGKLELGMNVDPRNGSGDLKTPEKKVKTKKRKSRVDVAIGIHEDLPGRTPLVKKIVSMNPASPGTDLPKENLEHHGSVEYSSQVEIQTPRTRRHHEAIGTPSTRIVRRLRSATTATLPYHSLFGGSPGS